MVEQLNAPETGHGPYGVEHSEEDSFYYVTLNGTRTGKSYPIGKTAFRAVRKLNDAWPLEQAVTAFGPGPNSKDIPSAGFLEDEPKAKPPKSPKARAAGIEKAIKAAKGGKPKAPTPAPKPAEGCPAKPDSPSAGSPHKEPKAAPVLEFSSETFKGTREQWLNAFTDKARVVFKQRGYELPEKIRVSVGFMFRSPKAIGQCWAESASADGHREVFINPTQADSARVADILTHELAHCLFGPEEKHGKNFKAAVTALGLEGKATATVAGDAWREWAFPILSKLGPIPHGAIDPSASGVKKQTTRLLKCECEECGFIFRATAKHVNGKALRCPDLECEGIVKVDGGDEDEGG